VVVDDVAGEPEQGDEIRRWRLWVLPEEKDGCSLHSCTWVVFVTAKGGRGCMPSFLEFCHRPVAVSGRCR